MPAWEMGTVLGIVMEMVAGPGLSVGLEKGRKRTNLFLDYPLLWLGGAFRLCFTFGGFGCWHDGF